MGWVIFVLSSFFYILIDVWGNVEVKKVEWKIFNKVEFGMIFSSEDKVKLGSNVFLIIYCSDKNKRVVEGLGIYFVFEKCFLGKFIIKVCLSCNNDDVCFVGVKEEGLK